MTSERYGFIQIDVDPLWAVRRAYGIAAQPPDDRHLDPVWDEAVPRFLQLFRDAKVRATFFILGADARHPLHRRRIEEIAASGHEIANHSFSHRFDLGVLPPEEMQTEILSAQEALGEAAGRAPAGFRCPGYGMTGALMREIRAAGFLYDSSILPSPWGFALRAITRRLSRGGSNASALQFGGGGQWRAPLSPYNPDLADFHRPSFTAHAESSGGAAVQSFWEIPVSVLPFLRFPIHSSAALALGIAYSYAALRLCRHAGYCLNYAFHGLDLLDTSHHPVTGNRVERLFFEANFAKKSAHLRRILDWIVLGRRICRADEWAGAASKASINSK